jgi:hypothetical protein
LRIGHDVIPALENAFWIRTEPSIVRTTSGTVESVGDHTYALKLPSTPKSSSFRHVQISVTLGQ